MDISQAKIPPLRILGEVPNPYKLSNAQTAMENLKSSNSRITMPTSIPEGFANDNVSGFTIKDCENALRGNVRNFEDFY